MIKDEMYYQNICSILAAFESEIKLNSASNLHNINIFAENITKNIFNILFDFKLENANGIKHNQPGFDLLDLNQKKLVQVTSTNTAEKISTSIDSCVKEHPNFEYYFFGLFSEEIKKETKKYQYYNKKNISVKKENLLNFASISVLIQNADLVKKKKISKYLETQFNYFQRKKSSRLEGSYLPFLEDFFSEFTRDFWLNYTDFAQVNHINKNYVEHLQKITEKLSTQIFPYKVFLLDKRIKKLSNELRKYLDLFSEKMVLDPNDIFYHEDKSWKHFAYKDGTAQEYENSSKEWDKHMYDLVCNITILLNKFLLTANKKIKFNNFPKQEFLIGDSYGVRNGQIPAMYKPKVFIHYNKKNRITLLTKVKIRIYKFIFEV